MLDGEDIVVLFKTFMYLRNIDAFRRLHRQGHLALDLSFRTAIDAWLTGIERRDRLQGLFEGLDHETLRAIADHYNLRLTRAEANSQASLRRFILLRLLERRQDGARRRRGRR